MQNKCDSVTYYPSLLFFDSKMKAIDLRVISQFAFAIIDKIQM